MLWVMEDSTFLSTLSLRRATRNGPRELCRRSNFYPRSPCGERRVVHVAQDPSPGRISIHALLAESDQASFGVVLGQQIFLSTLSLRRATFAGSDWVLEFPISIHALLAESDLWVLRKVPILGIFLSTLSLRRATGQTLINFIRI